MQDGTTLTLGTHKNLKSLKLALRPTNHRVSECAHDLLEKPAFKLACARTEVNLVKRSVRQLGSRVSATYAQVCAMAVGHGLELCPAEVGPALRLAYDHPGEEWLRIAMEPIVGLGGYPRIFDVGHDSSNSWLHCSRGGPDSLYNPNDCFVFVVPRT